MPEFARAREIVLRHGWNTTCYQILNPGMKHWFSASADAVIGYVECAGHRLVAGAPICAAGELSSVMTEWHTSHDRICYVGAESRLNRVAMSEGYGVAAIGSQPLWRPSRFLEAFDHHRSLKEQRRRARAKGVTVREWNPEMLARDEGVIECLRAWLASKPIPNMRFLVEPNVFTFWGDRRLFVAERDGQVCGFVVLCPIPSRKGWLTEDFIRHPNAPNGTVELALYEAISSIRDFELVTMGMCPLSRLAPPISPPPAWLAAVSAVGRKIGRVFYNFQGLEDFKGKFQPDEWEAVTLVRAGEAFRPSDLVAVIKAFTGYHPALMPWHYAMRKLGINMRI